MKILVRAMALCLLLAPLAAGAQPVPSATAATPAPTNAQALAGFDRYVGETLAAWGVPGVAISVVRNGEIVLNRGYGPLTVRLDAGTLTGSYNDDTGPLARFHYDVFDATTENPEHVLLDARVQFLSDFYGRVSGVRVAMEPAVEPAVFERQPDARLSEPAFLARLTGTYDLGGSPVVVSLAGASGRATAPQFIDSSGVYEAPRVD